ncbi:fatty acid desaturase family protein [Streptomyces sp. NPDC002536]
MSEPRQDRRLDTSLLRHLAKANQRRVVLHAAGVLAVYTVAVVVAMQAGLGATAVVASMVSGVVLAGFLNAAHDCVHRSHLRSKKANRIMGAVWSTPLLVNFSVYRYQHLVHHRYTGVEGDTEPDRTYPGLHAYLYALTGISLWRHTFATIARNCRGVYPASINNGRRRAEAVADNRALCGWLLAALALTVAFPRELAFAYWLPLYFAGPAIIFLALPEHYGLWGSPDIARNTRTVRSNPATRFLLWNANYHAEHHRYPAVATLNLHRLHRAMPEPHPIQESSYLGFHVKLARELGAKSPAGHGEPETQGSTS